MGRMRHLPGTRLMWLLAVSILLLASLSSPSLPTAMAAKEETNLYKILGVSKTATVQQIKKAYRKMALATHPDKVKDMSKEEAAEKFRKVVHAFEILSDAQSRKVYDRTGRTDGGVNNGNNNGNQRQNGWSNFNFNFRTQRNSYTKPKLKDKFKVKEAMSRVMHIVSFEQLKTVMTDENDVLERNLLMCFVNPPQDKHVDEEMVFPYPFAAMSDQGIWWEDLLQTVKIRYHKGNEITRFFKIPPATALNSPVFVFGKRGQKLDRKFPQLKTRSRKEFENWVWKQLEIKVHFFNKHPHPVEVYWIHGTRASLKFTLGHWEGMYHTTKLSHEWWVRDVRTDTHRNTPGRHRLSDETCIARWKIVDDAPEQELIIEPKECFDLSGHCSFWKRQGECTKNPGFMAEKCQLTCRKGKCDPKYIIQKEKEEEEKRAADAAKGDGGSDGGDEL